MPYMGPGDYDAALQSHAASAFTSARHARIKATLANIATAGRKRMQVSCGAIIIKETRFFEHSVNNTAA
jgi:hypothetical protein